MGGLGCAFFRGKLETEDWLMFPVEVAGCKSSPSGLLDRRVSVCVVCGVGPLFTLESRFIELSGGEALEEVLLLDAVLPLTEGSMEERERGRRSELKSSGGGMVSCVAEAAFGSVGLKPVAVESSDDSDILETRDRRKGFGLEESWEGRARRPKVNS